MYYIESKRAPACWLGLLTSINPKKTWGPHKARQSCMAGVSLQSRQHSTCTLALLSSMGFNTHSSCMSSSILWRGVLT